MSPRQQFINGVRTVAPLAIGIVPFGLLCGVIPVNSGIPQDLSFAMSQIVFAGASQLVASQLIAAGAPWFIVVLSASIVNLRMLMYSAALAPHFAALPWRWKGLNAYLLTDQSFAVSVARYEQEPEMPFKQWFYLGTALTMWVPWQIAAGIGVLVGRALPPSWGLDFAAPLSFIAIWIPGLKDRPMVVAAVVAGLVALVFAFLPYRLGLLVGALAGIAAGYLFERARR